jgi:hypothetical protein
MKNYLFAFLLLFGFSSCKLVKGYFELKKTRVKTYNYKLSDKDIVFIPMHHLGKKEFYDNVKGIVENHKKNGYKVYYELITYKFEGDSLQKDTLRRKIRRLRGFSGTYKETTKNVPFFKKYVQQPSYPDLGISKDDIRADVNYLDLIHQWEKLNGKIPLDSVDFNTPLNKEFKRQPFYTRKEYHRILIDYRNDNLVNMIKSGSDNKIIILYGAGHRKGFHKRLKTAD